jgi:hypothetical protein
LKGRLDNKIGRNGIIKIKGGGRIGEESNERKG